MTEENKQLTESTAESQITNTLMSAISGGQLQPEQLKMVLDAQERILDRQARQDFAIDMSKCQSEMPKVLKNANNNQTHSKYEQLDSLNNAIKPCYTKWGFAVSFNSFPPQNEGYVAMKATVSHRSGATTEHTMELPPDNMGMQGKVNKTAVHGLASTRSYLRRYLLREIFNITTTEDVDDDAQSSVSLVSDEIADDLSSLMKTAKANKEKFLSYFGVNEVKLLNESQAVEAYSILNKRIQAMNEKEVGKNG